MGADRFHAVDAFGIFLMRQFCESLPISCWMLPASTAQANGKYTGESSCLNWARPGDPGHPGFYAQLERLSLADDRPAKSRAPHPADHPDLVQFDSHRAGRALVMAATVLIIMPILFVFIYFQRWIVQGFTMSGFSRRSAAIYPGWRHSLAALAFGLVAGSFSWSWGLLRCAGI